MKPSKILWLTIITFTVIYFGIQFDVFKIIYEWIIQNTELLVNIFLGLLLTILCIWVVFSMILNVDGLFSLTDGLPFWEELYPKKLNEWELFNFINIFFIPYIIIMLPIIGIRKFNEWFDNLFK